jgi:PKD repeat protein
MMQKLLVLVALCLVAGGVSATPVNFTEWTPYGDAWKANNDTHTIVKWNATGSHTWLSDGNATIVNKTLVVAGGGGGGGSSAGGGGAGGYNESTDIATSSFITIFVGSGGSGGAPNVRGTNGTFSTFGTLNMTGGGGGGYFKMSGFSGGSGGGGGGRTAAAGGDADYLVPRQGYDGGASQSGDTAGQNAGGGGGGASAVGANGALTIGGYGGNGSTSNITGEPICYSGGGSGFGGAGSNVGSCGGGIGGIETGAIPPTSGTSGLGGGGGGGISGAAGANGGSGVVIISYLKPAQTPPVASFTCTPTSTTLGTPITCTDESSDTPTNWTYYWGDGNVTDGTQNPSYTYPFTGTFSINQTVNNTLGSSWYNRSDYITISNLTSFHQQDIYLTGQYNITFNVKSSTTNLPIANVTILDAVSGQTYHSTTGTGYLTEPAGLIYVTFIADGYQTKQVTYVVDQDETHEVSLTPVSPSPTSNTNTIFIPRLVRLRAVDNWRTPLTPVTITASYISDTLPNNDREYLMSAFGISSSVVDLMLNSSVAMSGVTGIDGSNTFSMFPALTYNLTVTNETMGVHCQQNLAPADTDYVLFCPTDAQKAAVIPLSQTLNRSYIWVTEPNASFVTINASYQDLTGLTSSVLFNVSVVDNNTVIYSKNFGNPGTSLVLDNYTMPNIRGMQIKSYLAYNRSAS